ncbi:hypothetical protein BLNAU_8175 [Blattamonas nauphoetae]|uniref:Uncharacterized protein n=1 Tax=Blattamonas nauphoetae TaxID=2049346 RepID=A0ABQ9XZG3_9EUKA|nr:hypothetical protein BLNAU_8175 [Blattamonas nauphoetae]
MESLSNEQQAMILDVLQLLPPFCGKDFLDYPQLLLTPPPTFQLPDDASVKRRVLLLQEELEWHIALCQESGNVLQESKKRFMFGVNVVKYEQTALALRHFKDAKSLLQPMVQSALDGINRSSTTSTLNSSQHVVVDFPQTITTDAQISPSIRPSIKIPDAAHEINISSETITYLFYYCLCLLEIAILEGSEVRGEYLQQCLQIASIHEFTSLIPAIRFHLGMHFLGSQRWTQALRCFISGQKTLLGPSSADIPFFGQISWATVAIMVCHMGECIIHIGEEYSIDRILTFVDLVISLHYGSAELESLRKEIVNQQILLTEERKKQQKTDDDDDEEDWDLEFALEEQQNTITQGTSQKQIGLSLAKELDFKDGIVPESCRISHRFLAVEKPKETIKPLIPRTLSPVSISNLLTALPFRHRQQIQPLANLITEENVNLLVNGIADGSEVDPSLASILNWSILCSLFGFHLKPLQPHTQWAFFCSYFGHLWAIRARVSIDETTTFSSETLQKLRIYSVALIILQKAALYLSISRIAEFQKMVRVLTDIFPLFVDWVYLIESTSYVRLSGEFGPDAFIYPRVLRSLLSIADHTHLIFQRVSNCVSATPFHPVTNPNLRDLPSFIAHPFISRTAIPSFLFPIILDCVPSGWERDMTSHFGSRRNTMHQQPKYSSEFSSDTSSAHLTHLAVFPSIDTCPQYDPTFINNLNSLLVTSPIRMQSLSFKDLAARACLCIHLILYDLCPLTFQKLSTKDTTDVCQSELEEALVRSAPVRKGHNTKYQTGVDEKDRYKWLYNSFSPDAISSAFHRIGQESQPHQPSTHLAGMNIDSKVDRRQSYKLLENAKSGGMAFDMWVDTFHQTSNVADLPTSHHEKERVSQKTHQFVLEDFAMINKRFDTMSIEGQSSFRYDDRYSVVNDDSSFQRFRTPEHKPVDLTKGAPPTGFVIVDGVLEFDENQLQAAADLPETLQTPLEPLQPSDSVHSFETDPHETEEGDMHPLLIESIRLKALLFFFNNVTSNVLRSTLAFCLAISQLHLFSNFEAAESLFFEAIEIAESVEKDELSSFTPLIFTHYGFALLRSFADTSLHLDHYINTLDAYRSLICYANMISEPKLADHLCHNIAAIALASSDFEMFVFYEFRFLMHAHFRRSVHTFDLFLSMHAITDVSALSGNWPAHFLILRAALEECLKRPQEPNGQTLDFFKMMIETFIDRGMIARGLDALAMVNLWQHPIQQRITLMLSVARSLKRQRAYAQMMIVIKQLDIQFNQLNRSELIRSRIRKTWQYTIDRASALQTSNVKNSKQGTANPLERSLELHNEHVSQTRLNSMSNIQRQVFEMVLLVSSMYYHTKQFTKALTWLDFIISMAGMDLVGLVAIAYYKRARILAELSLPSNPDAVAVLNEQVLWDCEKDLIPMMPCWILMKPNLLDTTRSNDQIVYLSDDNIQTLLKNSEGLTITYNPIIHSSHFQFSNFSIILPGGSKLYPPPRQSAFGHSTQYADTGSILVASILSFERAQESFISVGDVIRHGKASTCIASAYLHRVFPSAALFLLDQAPLLKLPAPNSVPPPPSTEQNSMFFEEISLQKNLIIPASLELDDSFLEQTASSNMTRSGNDDIASTVVNNTQLRTRLTEFKGGKELSFIEYYAVNGLESALVSSSVAHCIEGYISLAEVRFLGGRLKDAVAFWTEAKNTFSQFFLNGSSFIYPPNASKSHHQHLIAIFRRIVRFLFCFDDVFVKNNIMLIDALMQMDLNSNERFVDLTSPEIYAQQTRNQEQPSLTNLTSLWTKQQIEHESTKTTGKVPKKTAQMDVTPGFTVLLTPSLINDIFQPLGHTLSYVQEIYRNEVYDDSTDRRMMKSTAVMETLVKDSIFKSVQPSKEKKKETETFYGLNRFFQQKTDTDLKGDILESYLTPNALQMWKQICEPLYPKRSDAALARMSVRTTLTETESYTAPKSNRNSTKLDKGIIATFPGPCPSSYRFLDQTLHELRRFSASILSFISLQLYPQAFFAFQMRMKYRFMPSPFLHVPPSYDSSLHIPLSFNLPSFIPTFKNGIKTDLIALRLLKYTNNLTIPYKIDKWIKESMKTVENMNSTTIQLGRLLHNLLGFIILSFDRRYGSRMGTPSSQSSPLHEPVTVTLEGSPTLPIQSGSERPHNLLVPHPSVVDFEVPAASLERMMSQTTEGGEETSSGMSNQSNTEPMTRQNTAIRPFRADMSPTPANHSVVNYKPSSYPALSSSPPSVAYSLPPPTMPTLLPTLLNEISQQDVLYVNLMTAVSYSQHRIKQAYSQGQCSLHVLQSKSVMWNQIMLKEINKHKAVMNLHSRIGRQTRKDLNLLSFSVDPAISNDEFFSQTTSILTSPDLDAIRTKNPPSLPPELPHSVLYDSLSNSIAQHTRMLVILHLDELIFFFHPITGERRVFRFGGVSEQIFTVVDPVKGSHSGSKDILAMKARKESGANPRDDLIDESSSPSSIGQHSLLPILEQSEIDDIQSILSDNPPKKPANDDIPEYLKKYMDPAGDDDEIDEVFEDNSEDADDLKDSPAQRQRSDSESTQSEVFLGLPPDKKRRRKKKQKKQEDSDSDELTGSDSVLVLPPSMIKDKTAHITDLIDDDSSILGGSKHTPGSQPPDQQPNKQKKPKKEDSESDDWGDSNSPLVWSKKPAPFVQPPDNQGTRSSPEGEDDNWDDSDSKPEKLVTDTKKQEAKPTADSDSDDWGDSNSPLVLPTKNPQPKPQPSQLPAKPAPPPTTAASDSNSDDCGDSNSPLVLPTKKPQPNPQLNQLPAKPAPPPTTAASDSNSDDWGDADSPLTLPKAKPKSAVPPVPPREDSAADSDDWGESDSHNSLSSVHPSTQPTVPPKTFQEEESDDDDWGDSDSPLVLPKRQAKPQASLPTATSLAADDLDDIDDWGDDDAPQPLVIDEHGNATREGPAEEGKSKKDDDELDEQLLDLMRRFGEKKSADSESVSEVEELDMSLHARRFTKENSFRLNQKDDNTSGTHLSLAQREVSGVSFKNASSAESDDPLSPLDFRMRRARDWTSQHSSVRMADLVGHRQQNQKWFLSGQTLHGFDSQKGGGVLALLESSLSDANNDYAYLVPETKAVERPDDSYAHLERHLHARIKERDQMIQQPMSKRQHSFKMSTARASIFSIEPPVEHPIINPSTPITPVKLVSSHLLASPQSQPFTINPDVFVNITKDNTLPEGDFTTLRISSPSTIASESMLIQYLTSLTLAPPSAYNVKQRTLDQRQMREWFDVFAILLRHPSTLLPNSTNPHIHTFFNRGTSFRSSVQTNNPFDMALAPFVNFTEQGLQSVDRNLDLKIMIPQISHSQRSVGIGKFGTDELVQLVEAMVPKLGGHPLDVSASPLFLVTSPSLMMFPWESILETQAVRAFTICEALEKYGHVAMVPRNVKEVPSMADSALKAYNPQETIHEDAHSVSELTSLTETNFTHKDVSILVPRTVLTIPGVVNQTLSDYLQQQTEIGIHHSSVYNVVFPDVTQNGEKTRTITHGRPPLVSPINLVNPVMSYSQRFDASSYDSVTIYQLLLQSISKLNQLTIHVPFTTFQTSTFRGPFHLTNLPILKFDNKVVQVWTDNFLTSMMLFLLPTDIKRLKKLNHFDRLLATYRLFCEMLLRVRKEGGHVFTPRTQSTPRIPSVSPLGKPRVLSQSNTETTKLQPLSSFSDIPLASTLATSLIERPVNNSEKLFPEAKDCPSFLSDEPRFGLTSTTIPSTYAPRKVSPLLSKDISGILKIVTLPHSIPSADLVGFIDLWCHKSLNLPLLQLSGQLQQPQLLTAAELTPPEPKDSKEAKAPRQKAQRARAQQREQTDVPLFQMIHEYTGVGQTVIGNKQKTQTLPTQPIFILPITDLLDLSPQLYTLITLRPQLTFIFVPASDIVLVDRIFCKFHDALRKPADKSDMIIPISERPSKDHKKKKDRAQQSEEEKWKNYTMMETMSDRNSMVSDTGNSLQSDLRTRNSSVASIRELGCADSAPHLKEKNVELRPHIGPYQYVMSVVSVLQWDYNIPYRFSFTIHCQFCLDLIDDVEIGKFVDFQVIMPRMLIILASKETKKTLFFGAGFLPITEKDPKTQPCIVCCCEEKKDEHNLAKIIEITGLSFSVIRIIKIPSIVDGVAVHGIHIFWKESGSFRISNSFNDDNDVDVHATRNSTPGVASICPVTLNEGIALLQTDELSCDRLTISTGGVTRNALKLTSIEKLSKQTDLNETEKKLVQKGGPSTPPVKSISLFYPFVCVLRKTYMEIALAFGTSTLYYIFSEDVTQFMNDESIKTEKTKSDKFQIHPQESEFISVASSQDFLKCYPQSTHDYWSSAEFPYRRSPNSHRFRFFIILSKACIEVQLYKPLHLIAHDLKLSKNYQNLIALLRSCDGDILLHQAKDLQTYGTESLVQAVSNKMSPYPFLLPQIPLSPFDLSSWPVIRFTKDLNEAPLHFYYALELIKLHKYVPAFYHIFLSKVHPFHVIQSVFPDVIEKSSFFQKMAETDDSGRKTRHHVSFVMPPFVQSPMRDDLQRSTLIKTMLLTSMIGYLRILRTFVIWERYDELVENEAEITRTTAISTGLTFKEALDDILGSHQLQFDSCISNYYSDGKMNEAVPVTALLSASAFASVSSSGASFKQAVSSGSHAFLASSTHSQGKASLPPTPPPPSLTLSSMPSSHNESGEPIAVTISRMIIEIQNMLAHPLLRSPVEYLLHSNNLNFDAVDNDTMQTNPSFAKYCEGCKQYPTLPTIYHLPLQLASETSAVDLLTLIDTSIVIFTRTSSFPPNEQEAFLAQLLNIPLFFADLEQICLLLLSTQTDNPSNDSVLHILRTHEKHSLALSILNNSIEQSKDDPSFSIEDWIREKAAEDDQIPPPPERPDILRHYPFDSLFSTPSTPPQIPSPINPSSVSKIVGYLQFLGNRSFSLISKYSQELLEMDRTVIRSSFQSLTSVFHSAFSFFDDDNSTTLSYGYHPQQIEYGIQKSLSQKEDQSESNVADILLLHPIEIEARRKRIDLSVLAPVQDGDDSTPRAKTQIVNGDDTNVASFIDLLDVSNISLESTMKMYQVQQLGPGDITNGPIKAKDLEKTGIFVEKADTTILKRLGHSHPVNQNEGFFHCIPRERKELIEGSELSTLLFNFSRNDPQTISSWSNKRVNSLPDSLRIFVRSQSISISEQLDLEYSVDLLIKHCPFHLLPLLDFVIEEEGRTDEWIHTLLIFVLKRLVEYLSESVDMTQFSETTDPHQTYVSVFKIGGIIGFLRRRLISFLKHSVYYNPIVIGEQFEKERRIWKGRIETTSTSNLCLFDEECTILFSRANQHSKALSHLTSEMNAVNEAETYCHLYAEFDCGLQRQLVDSLTRQKMDDGDLVKMILGFDQLSPSDRLSLIPDRIPFSTVFPFIFENLQKMNSTQRNGHITQSLLKSSDLLSEARRTQFTSKRYEMAAHPPACVVCGVPFGTYSRHTQSSAESLQVEYGPDGSPYHPLCYQEMINDPNDFRIYQSRPVIGVRMDENGLKPLLTQRTFDDVLEDSSRPFASILDPVHSNQFLPFTSPDYLDFDPHNPYETVHFVAPSTRH